MEAPDGSSFELSEAFGADNFGGGFNGGNHGSQFAEEASIEEWSEVGPSASVDEPSEDPGLCTSSRRKKFEGGPAARLPVPGRAGPRESALRGFAQRTSDNILSVENGLCFDYLPEAYEYFNLYSWEFGFGIRYGRSKCYKCKSGPRKDVVYQTMQQIVCGCQGFPNKKNTSSIRCGCKTMIRLLRSDDHGWYIKDCILEHNHPLSRNNGEKLCWSSHKHIDRYTRDLVRNLCENNVPLTKVYIILGNYFGSVEDIPFNKRSLENLCKQISKEEANDDVRKTMDLFTKTRDNDPSIRTLIWVNGKSKLDYQYFGDAITFDTTYKTNLYGMPFGLFVGVNNHFQSIIFSGVLMRQETIESFEWIFREFTSLVGGKPPVTILTDECRAMEVAIERVFKNTTHRWCKWHVLKMVKEGLGSVYSKNSNFKAEFHKLINYSITLMEKYDLKEHHFLTPIYESRHRWAKPFFSGIFCAKMTSMQRSESANHMLKGYVPLGAAMHIFVKQYNKLIADRISKEDSENQRTRMGGVVLKTGWPIEKHAASIYTSKMREMFSEHIFDSAAYNLIEIVPNLKYQTVHSDASRREKWSKVQYEVTISDDGGLYTCECGLAEHMGMLCCHSIRVMLRLGVDKVPDAHILKRWTKNASDVLPQHLAHLQKDRGSLRSESYRHASLHVAALELVNIGDKNIDCYHEVLKYLKDGKEKFGQLYQHTDGRSLQEILAITVVRADEEAAGNIIVSGQLHSAVTALVRNHPEGRPTNTRDKPSYELKRKRTKFCTFLDLLCILLFY
ncbi:hypothetical protein BRADI_3g33745v3 [Brachypodium distachyon]|uniref:SWIM-type domain-containing protein n=1 Tax=Brachypodium distachyon TaxID=15368 RepID=A0A2K2D0X4_BRADI|nr:hypothetical protein BRADI_3g33745v3 [Brachypodium distachyon]